MFPHEEAFSFLFKNFKFSAIFRKFAFQFIFTILFIFLEFETYHEEHQRELLAYKLGDVPLLVFHQQQRQRRRIKKRKWKQVSWLFFFLVNFLKLGKKTKCLLSNLKKLCEEQKKKRTSDSPIMTGWVRPSSRDFIAKYRAESPRASPPAFTCLTSRNSNL